MLELTPREKQVLELMTQGLSNKMIALRLGTTAQTVKNQLYLLYQKLGVHTRVEAVVSYLKGGV